MKRLTGYQRYKLTRLWQSSYKDKYDKETFIKSVCKQKGLVYTLPIKPTKEIPVREK